MALNSSRRPFAFALTACASMLVLLTLQLIVVLQLPPNTSNNL